MFGTTPTPGPASADTATPADTPIPPIPPVVPTALVVSESRDEWNDDPPDPASCRPNPATTYLAALGVGSRSSMASALKTIAAIVHPAATLATLPWHRLRFGHTSAVRAELMARGYAPKTGNRMLAALRGTLKTAWLLHQMSRDDYARAAEIGAIKGQRLPTGRHLSADEKADLIAVCRAAPGAAGVRDVALLAVFAALRPRRAEVARLWLDDYHRALGAYPAWVVLHGKGGKDRKIALAPDVAEVVEGWITVRGLEPGALFLPVNKGGRVVRRVVIRDAPGRVARAELRGMTNEAVYQLCDRRARAAGIAGFCTHDFRRTFAGELFDAGTDLATVQHLMGHENPKTTAGYDRRGEEPLIKAAVGRRLPRRTRGTPPRGQAP